MCPPDRLANLDGGRKSPLDELRERQQEIRVRDDLARIEDKMACLSAPSANLLHVHNSIRIPGLFPELGGQSLGPVPLGRPILHTPLDDAFDAVILELVPGRRQHDPRPDDGDHHVDRD